MGDNLVDIVNSAGGQANGGPGPGGVSGGRTIEYEVLRRPEVPSGVDPKHREVQSPRLTLFSG